MKAAVIGTGKISAEHLRFLQESPRAELVGVCDLSEAAATYHAKAFGAAGAYTDLTRMLAEAKPEVVHVLTPARTHAMMVRQCLDAGAHVICEKPVALSRGEFDELWAHAQRVDRRLVEDHNYRFNEPVREIERMVRDGELGDVREVDVRMALGVRRGGRYADENLPHPSHQLPAGVIHEFVSHLCYLTLRFLPSVDRVAAAWSNHGNGDVFKYDDLDALVIGGGVHGRIRFSSHTSPDGFELVVRGSKGEASTDLFLPAVVKKVARPGGAQLTPLVNQFAGGALMVGSSARNFYRKVMQVSAYEGLHVFLEQTYAALASGEQPPVSHDDMARTIDLIEKLLAEEVRV